MKPAAFSPRTFFIAAMTAVLVLAIAGWSLWSVVALRYRSLIDAWIDQGRAAGYQISFDDRQTFGFPRHIVMRLTNLRWRNADGIDFRTETLDLSATPWLWTQFDAKFKGHASLAVPTDEDGRSLILSGASGRAQVDVSGDGVWRSAKITVNDAKLGLSPNYLYHADRMETSVTRPSQPPKDHTQTGLMINGHAENILLPDAMPSPFGHKADKATVALRVMGQVPSVRQRAQVQKWNSDSGIIEFDDLSLSWGDLELSSKGTMGFDEDLQPEGAFAGTVANPEKVMETLKAQGFVDARDAGMLASAMKLFAKPAGRDTKGMEFPITLQLGGLFFGPVRIFTFPEIEWPAEPPAVK